MTPSGLFLLDFSSGLFLLDFSPSGLFYALGEQMLLLAGVVKTKEEAREKLETSITSGAALKKFREIVAAQAGDARVIDDPGLLPVARLRVEIKSATAGYVEEVNALDVAIAALRLGAGRVRAEDKVDHAVGFSRLVKIGERVEVGSVLAVIHANDEKALAEARSIIEGAIVLGEKEIKAPRLIAELLG